MTADCLQTRMFLRAVLVMCVVTALAGCQTIDFYSQQVEEPVPAAMEPPRELSMVSLPAYRIEPPDMLQIEMLKQVPLPPYRAEAYDVLQIQVMGTLLDQPINDYYLVEAEGTVNLGPAYGTMRVVGMTIEEIQQAIDTHLRQILEQPDVSVQLARATGTQPVTGEYLVGPDGTVNLRRYGAVHVAGKTISEARVAVEKHLSRYFDSPELSLDVLSYNSKYYYIVTQGAGQGDSIVRVPITGNETVLDAISNIQGLSPLSSEEIWIARPAPTGAGYEQYLPVDWDAISQGGSTATNYQLMPDDRVFIAQNDTIALSNFIGTMLGPLERVAGTTALIVNSVRGTQTLGRAYNRNRR